VANCRFTLHFSTSCSTTEPHSECYARAAGLASLVLADTLLTEAAPVFAGFEGRGFLLHKLRLIELRTAFAESAVIESSAAAISEAATKSHGFGGWNPRPPKTAESGAASVVVVSQVREKTWPAGRQHPPPNLEYRVTLTVKTPTLTSQRTRR
jgi:hypothetical protein